MKTFESKPSFQSICGRSSRRSTSQRSFPRLVIDDAISATRVLVAKTRSEIEDLNLILGSIVPVEAKAE